MGSPNEAAEPGSIDPPASDSDQYCLRWTNHGSHVLAVFRQLLCDEALVDVTLAAEGQSLRAHKMVLSACSSFFRTIFVSHPERHPIIILKDTKFAELKTLLEFMYRGEVSVEYGQLSTLLKTAENLRVKGLTEVSTTDHHHSNNPGPQTGSSAHPNTATNTAQPPLSPEPLPSQQPPLQQPHRHSLRRCPSGQAQNYSQYPAHHGGDADDPDVDTSPLLFDDRLAGSEPPFGSDDVESAGNEHPHALNPLPAASSAAAGLQSSHLHWSRERERDRLLHPHHYHPYSRHSDGPSNHHAYRDRHAQFQPQQQPHRHSPHYTTLDHRERDRYRPGDRSSSHSRSNSSPLLVKRELRRRSDSGTGPEKDLEQRFSPNAVAAAGDTLAAHSSPGTPLLPAPAAEEESSALIVVERFSPSEALLHPSATNNASTGPLDANEATATPTPPGHRGATKPPPSPRLVLRPSSTTNSSSAAAGEEGSRPRTPKQEAEDLRVSSASPPSNNSVNFRSSTGEAGGSSGGGGGSAGGAAQRRFSTWPSLQSESSDTESEDFPMASPSGSRNPSRGPPYRPGSASGMGPPQHIPLALKKEQDWEAGEGLSLPSGGTRPEGPPSRSRSRSPTFSESSSEYGRHADQEVQGSAYSGPGAANAAETASTLVPPHHHNQPSTSRGAHPTPSGGFPCGRCGVAFPSPSRLSRHLLTHNHLDPERDFGPVPSIFPRDNNEMMQRTSLSIKRRHLTSVLDHNTSAAAAAAAAAAGLYGRQTATHAATIASLAVEERFYEFGRLRTRHGSYEDSSISRNRATLFADDTGTSGLGSNSRLATAGNFGDPDPGDREAPESHRSVSSASLNVRGLGSMFSHAMESSALGSMPSVAMLASLMGGGNTEGHPSSDLALGPVMFPRLGAQEAQQLSSAVSTASMVHSMSSLGLSSLSMGLNLAPGQVPPPHHSAPPGNVPNAATHRGSATSAPTGGTGSGGAVAGASSSSNNSSSSSGTPALCKFCGKSFLELGALMAHLPFHTGERPFRCDFCGKAFKLRHHMKDHARVHTGERPFPCRLCGKTFSRSTILKAHEKTHLPKTERGFLQPPSPPDGLGSGP